MSQRINFTGRQRLTRDKVDVEINRDGNKLQTTVRNLDLSGLELDDDATVFVEIYHQTFFHRFASGTVAEPVLPNGSEIEDFAVPELLHCRVKVVGASNGSMGRLLAVADQVPVTVTGDTGAAQGLLPIVPASLGGLMWRMDTSDIPQILINAQIEDWKSVAMSPWFQSLVFPEALRRVAIWAVEQLRAADPSDENLVLRAWCMYLKEVLGDDPVPVADSGDDPGLWADEMSALFAEKFELDRHWMPLVDTDEETS